MADSFNVGDAYIELRLRQDKLHKDSQDTVKALNEQKAKLEGVAKSAEQAGDKSNQAFTGIAATALKAVAVMGSVELGLGAVNVGADLLSGNIEDAAQGLEQLPAGIGPVVRQLKDLLGTVTGIRAETEALQRTTENLEAAMAKRFATSLQGLRDEEAAVMSRLKIEQQIALLGEADSDEVARLKQKFEASNRLAEAEQAIADARREASEFALSTSVEESERSEQIAKLNKLIEEQEQKIESTSRALERYQKEFGSSDKRMKDSIDRQEEQLAIYANERQSLVDLQKARIAEIQRIQEKANQIKEMLPLIKELNEAEEAALERSIEKAKTEEQKRESEHRIREAEKEAAEKERIAKRELEHRKRMQKEAFDEQIRLMNEASEEAERLAKKQLDTERRIGDLRFSIRQKELGLAGNDIQAEVERISRDAEQAAKAAGNQTERDLIERERRLSIQQALGRAGAGDLISGASASIGSIESAISNLQSAALQREDPSIAQRREQIALQKRMAEGIDNVADKIEEQPQAAAVGP